MGTAADNDDNVVSVLRFKVLFLAVNNRDLTWSFASSEIYGKSRCLSCKKKINNIELWLIRRNLTTVLFLPQRKALALDLDESIPGKTMTRLVQVEFAQPNYDRHAHENVAGPFLRPDELLLVSWAQDSPSFPGRSLVGFLIQTIHCCRKKMDPRLISWPMLVHPR